MPSRAEDWFRQAVRDLRHPNSVPQRAPFEFYDAEQSERAVAAADRILGFCEHHLA